MSAPRLDSALRTSAPVFAALGDQTRLRLLARLCAGEPMSITQLSSGAGVSRQAITKHLRVLAGAGLARDFRHGRERLWELQPQHLREARDCLNLISRQWENALARLKDSIEGED